MIEKKNIDDVVVVSLNDTNKLNAPIAEELKESLREIFSKTNVDMIFNLQGITFIDSSGFGVFLATLKAAGNHYGRFKICNVSSQVMELFKLLQLHHVFEIYDELDTCLKSFER